MTKGPGYLLPTVISPTGTRCITLEIPDDPGHIRAFLGQLDMLSFWWTWERDALKQGTQAARRWQSVVDSARQQLDFFGGCPVGFDIRVVDCVLQKTEDGGENWTDVIELGDCAGQGPAGQDGASAELRVFEGWIQWRQDDNNPTWTNLIALEDLEGPQGIQGPQGPAGAQGVQGPQGPQGPAGEDCDCEDPPPINPEEPDDGTRCAIAIALSNRAKQVWDDLWQHTNEITDLAASAITIGSAVVGAIAGFFLGGPPGAIGGTALGGLVGAAFGANSLINGLLEAAFDEAALDRFRCAAYCLLSADSNEITQGFINSWIDLLVADPANAGIFGSDEPGASISELMKLLPLSEWQWSAWVAGTVDPAACAECCDEEPPIEPPHDWSATFNFANQDWGFYKITGGSSSSPKGGVYIEGVGWKSELWVYLNTIEHIHLNIMRDGTLTGVTAGRLSWVFRAANDQQLSAIMDFSSTPTDNIGFPTDDHSLRYDQMDVPSGATTGTISFRANAGTEGTSGTDWSGSEGEIVVREIKIWGTGTRPAALDGVPD